MAGPFTLGDTFSNVVVGQYDGGPGTVVGIVIQLSNTNPHWRQAGHNYVIYSNGHPVRRDEIHGTKVERLNVSGGKYKKSRNTRRRNRKH